jgi:hypothetical protein
MATIYDKSVNELLKDFVDNWTKNDGVFQKKDTLDWFNENYPKIKASTVSAHITKFSVNNKNRAHYHAHSDGRDDILFRINENTFRKYNSTTDSEPIYKLDTNGKKISEDDDNEDMEYDTAFAYEEDLKNYLAKNLDIIESGLKLYEEDGISGLEYEVKGRFIDILAVDKNKNFVVIELKVSRSYDRVIGQLLRYKNWIQKELANDGQIVRGIIIANEISEDLIIACMGQPNIKLYEYELSVKLCEKDF